MRSAALSSLLIDEYPLILLPTLAQVIGLNEAIFCQQVHYWCQLYRQQKDKRHYHKGRWWVYNTDEQWCETNFTFWSPATVKRARTSAKQQGVLLVDRFNLKAYDRTNWYSIDRKRLNEKYTNWATGQNDQMDQVTMTRSNGSDRPDAAGQDDQIDQGVLTPPIPETTRELTEIIQNWPTVQAELEMIVPASVWQMHQFHRNKPIAAKNGSATISCRDPDWHKTQDQWTDRTLSGILGRGVRVVWTEEGT